MVQRSTDLRHLRRFGQRWRCLALEIARKSIKLTVLGFYALSSLPGLRHQPTLGLRALQTSATAAAPKLSATAEAKEASASSSNLPAVRSFATSSTSLAEQNPIPITTLAQRSSNQLSLETPRNNVGEWTRNGCGLW